MSTAAKSPVGKVVRNEVSSHQVVPPAEWVAARKELLAKEKVFSKLREELTSKRLELPWEKVNKQYVFDGPQGKESLADLFAGKSQLIVYHFMFGPTWEQGCPGCSFLADHFDGSLPHLAAKDVSFVAVSRAPLGQLEIFKKRMGWNFKWVSSNATDFNYDYNVSFRKEDLEKGQVTYNYEQTKGSSDELPGGSAFYKDPSGNIYHTYSSFGRGLENMIGAYSWLDIAPKGRDEDAQMPHKMAWVRHHDRY